MTGNYQDTESFQPVFSGQPINRDRLFEILDSAVNSSRKLISIVAPAGYGKTVLVTSWLKTRGEYVIWISSSVKNDDGYQILGQVIKGIAKAVPGFCQEILPSIHYPQADSQANIHNFFLNSFAAISKKLILCVDDYHLVSNPDFDDLISRMVERLPGSVSIILLSRTRLSIPVARYRVRGQLVEMTAADLSFTLEETGDFIRSNHGLTLAEDALRLLVSRAEGWPAAIHLAAMLITSNKNPKDEYEIIQSISGNQEFISEYLLDEVLALQDDQVQRFLLSTCLVEKFDIQLGAQLSGFPPYQIASIIEYLSRSGLFIIALDKNARWFRYHHLFSSFLKSRMETREPERYNDLLAIAALWYFENGQVKQAVDCSFSGTSYERAIEIILSTWPDLLHKGQLDLMIGWCRQIPQKIFVRHPGLIVAYSWALILKGQYPVAGVVMNQFDMAIREKEETEADFRNSKEARRLSIEKLLISALLLHSTNQCDEGISLSRQAEDLSRPEFPLLEGNALIIQAHLYKQMGELDKAVTAFQKGISRTWREGNIIASIGAHIALSNLLRNTGDLEGARKTCQDGIALAQENSVEFIPAVAPLYIEFALLNIEFNRLDEAEEMLLKGLNAGRINLAGQFLFTSTLAQIGLLTARNLIPDALDILDGVIHSAGSDCSPAMLNDLKGLRLTLAIQGKHLGAIPAESDISSSVSEKTRYSTNFTSILIQSRMLASTGRISGALHLLNEAIDFLSKSTMAGIFVRFLIARSRMYQSAGDREKSRQDLELAHMLGDPAGFLRSFLDEPEYPPAGGERIEIPANPDPDTDQAGNAPLTIREGEVLKLIQQGLSNQEIAGELSISLSTVKKHTSSIFKKLGVTSRTKAAFLLSSKSPAPG